MWRRLFLGDRQASGTKKHGRNFIHASEALRLPVIIGSVPPTYKTQAFTEYPYDDILNFSGS